MKTITQIFLFLFGSMILISCEKVIDLDLNTADSRMVIEGNITSEQGPYIVTLSTSGDYYTAEGIEAISGAEIIITDDLEHSDTLVEVAKGIYHTQTINSEYHRTYSLEVHYNDLIYRAEETLPEVVNIDSLSIEKDEGGGPGGTKKDRYIVHCSFVDPIDEVNFYRFEVMVNGKLMAGNFFYYNVISDELYNGQVVHRTLRIDEVYPGDHITVAMHSIGVNTYEYFRTLNDALGGGGGGSTPYNPITNLNNNALGYFGAYAIDSDSLVVPN